MALALQDALVLTRMLTRIAGLADLPAFFGPVITGK